jgi:hypothetical protein
VWEEIALISNDTRSTAGCGLLKCHTRVVLIGISEKHCFHSVAFMMDRIE